MINITWTDKSELERVKKMLVALEIDTTVIEAEAVKHGKKLKTDSELKKELKSTFGK